VRVLGRLVKEDRAIAPLYELSTSCH
jgi:hypothetical protein